MISPVVAALVLLGYLGLLFGIARACERYRLKRSAWLTAFAIGIYCTSWTFYGAVGSAVSSGWDYLPIYVGPILMFSLGLPLLTRVIALTKAYHLSSISDLLSRRFARSQQISKLVTMVGLLSSVPYIALQLRAISNGVEVVSASSPEFRWLVTATSAAVLAAFAMIFGIRNMDMTRYNPGLVGATAFDSLFKLVAFVALAVVALGLIVGSNTSIPTWLPAQAPEPLSLVVLTLLSMAAMICLPRQFHMTFVEAADGESLRRAAPVVIAFLLAFAIGVIPIATIGNHLLPGIAGDRYVLSLPLSQGWHGLALLALLGGFAAAAGMIVVAAVALSNMLVTDFIMPALLQRAHRQGTTVPGNLALRRLTVVPIIMAAAGIALLTPQTTQLAALGIVSFGGVAQVFPSLLVGLYTARLSKQAAKLAILTGLVSWLGLVVVPTLAPMVFAQGGPDAITGIVVSTALNLGALVFGVQRYPSSLAERSQAERFLAAAAPLADITQTTPFRDIERLLQRAIGRRATKRLLAAHFAAGAVRPGPADAADSALLEVVERELSKQLGNASTHLLLRQFLSGQNLTPGQVLALVDDSSRRLSSSRDVLATTLDNLAEAVCLVDRQLRVVIWNQAYERLFDYPQDMLHIGCRLSTLMQHNLRASGYSEDELTAAIDRRLTQISAGLPHAHETELPSGQIVRLQGRATPDGGYVTSFSDITRLRMSERALEARVAERTSQLQASNRELDVARKAAEEASQSKTRFLAAASHDVLQPLNAARLFASSLADEAATTDHKQLAERVQRSIESADDLLRALLNLSRLESGGIAPNLTDFEVDRLLTDIAAEFAPVASGKGLKFRVVTSCCATHCDQALLRSVLQNLVSNAIRYSDHGGVVVGIRRRGTTALALVVADTGRGIPVSQRETIFAPFERLTRDQQQQGAGLGLATTREICDLLGLRLELESIEGQGTAFHIVLPRVTMVTTVAAVSAGPKSSADSDLDGRRVLCVDDNETVLLALADRFRRWGAQVIPLQSLEAVSHWLRSQPAKPHLAVLDYRLSPDATGMDVYQLLNRHFDTAIPTIVATAENAGTIADEINAAGVHYLKKPVEPAVLRALAEQLVRTA